MRNACDWEKLATCLGYEILPSGYIADRPETTTDCGEFQNELIGEGLQVAQGGLVMSMVKGESGWSYLVILVATTGGDARAHWLLKLLNAIGYAGGE